MKLKLFLISILVLLSLVGYKTYTETQVLKSINSYDSCITAKGSVIQTSYPATCVTLLGSRFTQPTIIEVDQQIDMVNPNRSNYYDKSRNFSFTYPNNLKKKEIDNPYPESDPREKIILLCEDGFETNHELGSPHCLDGGGIRIWYNPDLGWLGGCDEEKKQIISIGGSMQGACVYENGFGTMFIQKKSGNFLISATYSKTLTKSGVDQILSTFKFTD